MGQHGLAHLEPAAERDDRPDELDHPERPRPLEETVDRAEHATERETERPPVRTGFLGVA